MARSDKRYDAFYAHYQPFVASFLSRRVPNAAVDDLASEVFAVAWRRRNDVPDDALPWLYRTARNLVGNRYRADARRAAMQQKLRAIPVEQSMDPADIAGDREALFSALERLHDDDRELLLLIAWEGLSIQEIAVVMSLSPGAASVRLHRARQRLEREMTSDTRSESES